MQQIPALSRGTDPATRLWPSLREPTCLHSLLTLTPSCVGTSPPPTLQGTGLRGGRHRGHSWCALKPLSDLKNQRGHCEPTLSKQCYPTTADSPKSLQVGWCMERVNICGCCSVAGSRPGSQQAGSLLHSSPFPGPVTCPGHPAQWTHPGWFGELPLPPAWEQVPQSRQDPSPLDDPCAGLSLD